MTPARTRTRLTPAARRDQLLDSAKQIIAAEGLQVFTMEGLAKAAEVSAPLVYKYFSSRQDLLEALLTREYRRFVADALQMALQATNNFEDIVRAAVTSNFDHHAPGSVLPVLLSQREIASVIAAEQNKHSGQNARFLIKAAADSYHLTRRQAQLAIVMSSGASIAAAELAASAGLNREQTIEMAVAYIVSGIERIAGKTAGS